MCDIYREQHPLLNEDISDEEQKPLDPVHRSSPIVFRGYARSSAKGAAAIIRTWPDNLASLIPYIWMMLAVTGIIVFVFYNTVTVALLPAYAKALQRLENSEEQRGNGVYMHIIVNDKKEAEKDEYYPYIQVLANQYKDYRFYLIYLFNDTKQSKVEFSDKNKQMYAKNVKWVNKVIIKKVMLSQYLDASPLVNIWRSVPQTHLAFLVRAVSIWQKGGLAFNPVILTPQWLDLNYTKKLHEFLEKRNVSAITVHTQHKISKFIDKPKRINNIQDILSNAESDNFVEANMIGEESVLISEFKTNVNSTNLGTHNNTLESDKAINASQTKWGKQINYDFLGSNIKNSIANHSSLFPMFLDFIFHTKPDMKLLDSNSIENNKNNEPAKNDKVVEYLYTSSNEVRSNDLDRQSNHIANENWTSQEETQSFEYFNDINSTDIYHLMIDLEGHFIATKSHCHSFLGTLFTNSGYLEVERSVKDLIVAELTMYCEGVLSLCNIIDIIW